MHAALAGLIDRVIAKRQGRRFLEYLALFEAMQGWPRERLDAWRLERMQALVAHALTNVPYWRDVAKELGAEPGDFRSFADLEKLPPLTKDVIRAEGRRLYSEVSTGSRVTEKSSGGSTGRNIWLAVDIDTHDRRRAAGMMTERWDDVHRGTPLATLWGSPLEGKPSRASRLYDKLTNRAFFSVYGVDKNKLDEFADAIQRFGPEVISSYPSILASFARRLGKERCRRLGARIIYSSAEVLFDETRAELEDLFGATVRNRYATREVGLVAADCPRGEGLHLMDMRFHVEADAPEYPGALTELMITDLDNRAFPLLRYRIGDMGGLVEEPCPCGRPLRRLSSLDARVFDVIETPEGKMFGGSFFPILLRPADRTVEQFQVVQEALDQLSIKIVPGPNYSEERRAIILRQLAEKMGADMKVRLEEVDHIEPLPSGKHRFVVSKIREQRRA